MTRDYKESHGVTRVTGFTGDYNKLHGVIGEYNRLQGVTESYKGLQVVTGGYDRLIELKEVTTGNRELQGVTEG